jgi:flagellar hook-basal body complex protein FliE
VTAVSETEVAIDAVVAVRDRVIAAYEDIMKNADLGPWFDHDRL